MEPVHQADGSADGHPVTRRRPPSVLPLAFAAVVMLSAACGATPAPSGSVPGVNASAPAGSTAPGGSGVPLGPDASGRPDAIPSPAAGLDSLEAYRATLSLSFTGTQGGKSVEWTQTYVLTANRATGARMLEHGQTGLGDGPVPLPAAEGYDATTAYRVVSSGSPCVAATVAAGETTALVEPASLLPRVHAMTTAGDVPAIAGIEASAWTFTDQSVATRGESTISGSATTARSGGLILAYDLSIAGGHDVFDADTEGTYRWTYRLEPLAADAVVARPAGCPAPLPDMPLMPDAANVVRGPGTIAYETRRDVAAVTAFYQQAMPGAGFAADGDPWAGAMGTSMRWTKDGRTFVVAASTAIPVTVRITEALASGAPHPSPVPQPTTVAQGGTVRVSRSLTQLLGSSETPSALGSYHSVYHGTSPFWSTDKVAQDVIDATGDVAGSDVHYVVKEQRGSRKASVTEGYHVADKNWVVENGKLVSDDGMGYLSWVAWPLDLVVAIGIGSLRTEAAGTEQVDGRPAEVYRISGGIADDPTGMFSSFGLPITKTNGTVWVDQATGALVKANIDYTAEVKDADGSHGSATGSFTLDVSKAGQVQVTLP
jgi:hypothetical protein